MAFNAAAARAKRPFPLWVDAFLRDTQHLAADEVGAYMLILMVMWSRESCDYPDDDARLARVCRVSTRLWKSRVGPALRPFFHSIGGCLISRRLRQEAEYVEGQLAAQSNRRAGSSPKSSTCALPEVTPDADGETDENSSKPLISQDRSRSADTTAEDTADPSAAVTFLQPNLTDPSNDGSERGGASLALDLPGNLPLPLGDPPQPPEPKRPRRKPELPLPDNWVPSDRNVADAQASNLSPQDIRREADRFRDHHLARGSLFRDWDAAWRTWVSRVRPSDRDMAGAPFPGRHGQGRSLASIAAARRLADAP